MWCGNGNDCVVDSDGVYCTPAIAVQGICCDFQLFAARVAIPTAIIAIDIDLQYATGVAIVQQKGNVKLKHQILAMYSSV